jgi:Cu/Ag efflux pump CusA
MRWIIDSSLRFRLLVIAVAAVVLAFGVSELRDVSTDVLPEFTPPYVEIQTEALGLSADEVEQLITVPLEADLLNGIDTVDTIRSSSVPGMSSIVLVFKSGTDPFTGRALVQERLTQAVALPNVSKPPFMLSPRSSASRVLMIGLSNGSKPLTPIEQGLLARWTIRPRLLGVPGVSNVAIWGQREQQLQVQVDPRQLRERHVTLSQIVKTAGNAQIVSPLTFLEASTPGTGGFIETPTQRLQVRHVFDRLSTPAALSSVPVEGTNGLKLGDVSHIVEDHQPLIGDAVVHGGSGLMLVVEKLPGASTVEVTRGVEQALDDLRPGLGGLQTDTNSFRPASFVEDAIHNVTVTLIAATLLLVLALAALLAGWRTALVSVVAIGLSLVTGALVVDLLGGTMNAISFAGLGLAAAIIVTDAVVGAAAAGRRPDGDQPQALLSTVSRATMRARGPLTYGMLTALLVVLPVVVMRGRPGAFFDPIAIAYVGAVLASALVALTVTPALSLLLARRAAPGGRAESALLARLGTLYSASLERVLQRPRAVLLAAGGSVVAGLALAILLGASPIPSFKDRDLVVSLAAKPGTSQPVMTKITRDVSAKLQAIDGVKDVGGHIGRAVTGDQVVDVNSSELWVNVDRGANYDKTVGAVKRVVAGVQGVRHDVVTYSQQRVRDVGTLNNGDPAGKDGTLAELTGTRAPLDVRVFGEEEPVLRATAEKVRALVAGVDGVVAPRVDVDAAADEPTLEVEVDLARAQRFGIKPGDVRRAEATLIQGISVGSIFGKQKVFDVVVQGMPSLRTSVANVRNLLIDRPDGGTVRLADVANVTVKPSPTVIKRDSVSRRIDVVADIKGRSAGAVADDVQKRLERATFFPLEYHAEVLRESTTKEIGLVAIIGTAIAVLIATLLLMQAFLRSWPLATAVFLAVPAALVGGVLIAAVGGELSLGSLLGLAAIFAFTTRSSLLLAARLQLVDPADNGASSAALVVGRARAELAPLLTAALALAALMAPFFLRGSIPGLEIMSPMAAVVIGGLVTSMLVTLYVVPVLYLRFATPPESAEDLLHRWAGVPRRRAGDEQWIMVNPDVLGERVERKHILPDHEDGAGGEPEQAPVSPPPTQAS